MHVNTNIDFEIRSPKLRTAFLLCLAGVVLVFVGYQISHIAYTGAGLRTQTARSSTVYDTVCAEAFVLRHESLLSGTAAGIVVPVVDDGTKVSAGDAVAVVFGREEDAVAYYDMLDVDAEIEYYESMQNTEAISMLTDINAYNSKIDAHVFALLSAIQEGRLSSLPVCADNLRSSMTKRSIASGKIVDVSGTLNALYARKSELEAKTLAYTRVTADAAGYYVQHTDGYESDSGIYGSEDAFDAASFDTAAVDRLLALSPSEFGSAGGKLITDFQWFLVCKVPTIDIASLKIGGTAMLSFPESAAEDLKASIIALNADADGQTAAIFGSTAMDAEYANLRKTTVTVRTDSHSGFRVPPKAIRTVEGETGVYVLLGNVVKFRKTDIIYAAEEFYLAAVHAGDDDYLQAFDEIITEGTDLYDDKIIE